MNGANGNSHGHSNGSARRERLVVVGNGMAGVACVEQILKHAQKFEITIFGDETHVNYNRIMLSSVLAGEKSPDEIVLNSLEWYAQNEIHLRLGVRITEVDAERKTVTGNDGSVTPYDKLLLATGSSPLIPSLDWVQKEGVHVFRSLDDTRALLERSHAGAKAVVIGGGLLGLEAARGLQVQGCDVTVVHLMDRLMERQLDATGGGYLKAKMECMGVKVLVNRSTTEILGDRKAEGVAFKEGPSIDGRFRCGRRGHPPEYGVGSQSGAAGKPRHRCERLHGNFQPGHFCRRGMRRAQGHLLRTGRAVCLSREKFWRQRLQETKVRCTKAAYSPPN